MKESKVKSGKKVKVKRPAFIAIIEFGDRPIADFLPEIIRATGTQLGKAQDKKPGQSKFYV